MRPRRLFTASRGSWLSQCHQLPALSTCSHRCCVFAHPFPCFQRNNPFTTILTTHPPPQDKYRSLVALSSSQQEPRQFYRRPLPASCIAFGTAEGRQLFKEALEMGFMEAYFDLAPQLRTQVQPTYCGLSALVMVLNSFEMDPGRVWKAPWRWYHEDMLTCCLSADDLHTHGITLDQFMSIARCNGLNIELHQTTHPGESVDSFRTRLLGTCSQSLATSGTILVVAFDRKALKQTGSGHYALIGGYHPKRDLVLILETAAFKYPPHWAPVTSIYTGMASLDKVSGRPRGYMLLTKAFNSRTGLANGGEFSTTTASLGVMMAGNPPPSSPSSSPLQPPSSASHHLHRPPSSLYPPAQVKNLLNRLHLFCIDDAAYQAFISPVSVLDRASSGARLRLVADDWASYLRNSPLASLGPSCCCLNNAGDLSSARRRDVACCQQHHGAASSFPSVAIGATSSNRCECPCLVDKLLDHMLSLLLQHRPPHFFFTCQPLLADRLNPPFEDCAPEIATQVIFEFVSSAMGRRARLALERLPHRAYEWLTSDSGGPLTYRPSTSSPSSHSTGIGGSGFSPSPTSASTRRHPACALPLVTDSKIRATAMLTAFLLAYPYQTVADKKRPTSSTAPTVVEALKSSEYMLEELPHLAGQTCFVALTKDTQTELLTLSSILAQLVTLQRPPGYRCIE